MIFLSDEKLSDIYLSLALLQGQCHSTIAIQEVKIYRYQEPRAQWLRIYLPMEETQEVQALSLSQEDPLEEEMPTQSSILA